MLVLLETERVLRSSVRLDKNNIAEIFRELLEASDVAFEYENVVEHALFLFDNSNVDFADCLMTAHCQRLGCSAMLTFDLAASKIPGPELIAI